MVERRDATLDQRDVWRGPTDLEAGAQLDPSAPPPADASAASCESMQDSKRRGTPGILRRLPQGKSSVERSGARPRTGNSSSTASSWRIVSGRSLWSTRTRTSGPALADPASARRGPAGRRARRSPHPHADVRLGAAAAPPGPTWRRGARPARRGSAAGRRRRGSARRRRRSRRPARTARSRAASCRPSGPTRRGTRGGGPRPGTRPLDPRRRGGGAGCLRHASSLSHPALKAALCVECGP